MVVRASEGGVFHHVSTVSSRLRERGHEVWIAGPHAEWGDRLDVPIVEVEMVRPLSPRHDLRSARDLRGVIRRLRPDVVHSHGSKGGVMSRLARIGPGAPPVVHSPHGYAFAGYFTSGAERVAYRAAETALSPLTSRFLCVCEHEARLAAKVGSRRRIRVVHNGVDPVSASAPDPGLAALRERGPLIGCVSGLRPGKGVETLVEAMPAVLARHGTATLAIAGDGPEREAIERLASAAGIEDAVVFLGERDDVTGVLGSIDVFAMPSWAESFPYSVLEAMAAGCAIVSTDVGGVSEAIGGGAGVLVAPRDAGALAAALAALLDDPARAAALGEEALRRQRERFTLSGAAEGTLAVYDELISADRRAPDRGAEAENE